MGKRSNFKRRPQDKYRTFDPKPAKVLARHIPKGVRYWEPCAAGLQLVDNLSEHGAECVVATDIMPECEAVFRLDALTVSRQDVECTGVSHIITNPAWTRSVLHPMIALFSSLLPTWLLFDADWVHTEQSSPYQTYLRKVVSVGRVCWIEGTTTKGKDNCAWHLFDQKNPGPTEFVGPPEKSHKEQSCRNLL